MSRKKIEALRDRLEFSKAEREVEINLMKALRDLEVEVFFPKESKPTKKRFPVAPQPKPRKIEL